ncbi:MAG: hypothetical protein JW939_03800 [Candidatus Thermoplasmatota archaeon]|nr:hypothetical protein [Candidatus Thermoplasmatota archaeon]
MDRRVNDVDVLSEASDLAGAPTIPRNVAIAVFAILSLSGFLVGAFLPELIANGSSDEGTTGETKDILDVIIASTISSVDINGTDYTNIPVPTAFQVFFQGSAPSENTSSMDEPLQNMLEWLLGEREGYTFRVSPGPGMSGSAYITGNEGNGPPDRYSVREVPVGLDEDEGSVIFELRVWGVTGQ